MTKPKAKGRGKLKAVPEEGGQQEHGLTEAEQLQVLSAASAELLATVASDPKALNLVKRYPDETTRLFVAGCRAGAKAMGELLSGRVLAP